MKIKDLKKNYPLVYEAALKLGENPNQAESEQGWYFWHCMATGKIDEAKKECPELFDPSQIKIEE